MEFVTRTHTHTQAKKRRITTSSSPSSGSSPYAPFLTNPNCNVRMILFSFTVCRDIEKKTSVCSRKYGTTTEYSPLFLSSLFVRLHGRFVPFLVWFCCVAAVAFSFRRTILTLFGLSIPFDIGSIDQLSSSSFCCRRCDDTRERERHRDGCYRNIGCVDRLVFNDGV